MAKMTPEDRLILGKAALFLAEASTATCASVFDGLVSALFDKAVGDPTVLLRIAAGMRMMTVDGNSPLADQIDKVIEKFCRPQNAPEETTAS